MYVYIYGIYVCILLMQYVSINSMYVFYVCYVCYVCK